MRNTVDDGQSCGNAMRLEGWHQMAKILPWSYERRVQPPTCPFVMVQGTDGDGSRIQRANFKHRFYKLHSGLIPLGQTCG